MASGENHFLKYRLQYILMVAMGLIVAGYSFLAFDGQDAWYRLWYYTPAGIAAGAFVAERFLSRSVISWKCWIVDVAVISLCLARHLTDYPPASGHAIFAVYVLITVASPVARIGAAGLLLLTLFAKLYVWNGDITLWPGLAIGLIAGFIYRMLIKKQKVD